MVKWNPRSTYIRIFFFLSISIATALIPFSFFLVHEFSSYSKNEINKITEDKNTHILENLEFVFSKLKSYGLNMYEDVDIRRWLEAETDSPVLQNEAVISMKNYISTEDFIKGVYLINTRTNRVIDYNRGLYTFDSFFDQDMIEMVKKHNEPFLRYLNDYMDGTSQLYLIIPSIPAPNFHYGYIVLLLNKPLLDQFILKSNRDIGIEVVVLDKANQVVLGETNIDLRKELLSQSRTQMQGNFTLETDGHVWLANYSKMRSQDWVIYYMTNLDEWQSKVNKYQKLIYFCFITPLLILLVAVYWSTRKNLLPISRLAQRLQEKWGGSWKNQEKTSSAEHLIIEKAVDWLSNNVDRLSQLMRTHQDLITSEHMRKWINLGRPNESIRKYLKDHSGILDFTHLFMVVIRIEAYPNFIENHTFSSRQLYKFSMLNIAEEIIRENGDFAVEGIDLQGDHLVLIAASDQSDLIEPFMKRLQQIQHKIKTLLEIPVIISTSEPFHLNEDLRTIYQKGYELTLLKFISGQEKVFRSKDYDAFFLKTTPISNGGEINELIQAARLGNEIKLKDSLGHLFSQIEHLTYSECKLQLLLIIHTVLKSFEPQTELANLHAIQKKLDGFYTLQEVRSWLEQFLLDMMDKLKNVKTIDTQRESYEQIVHYISDHIHEPTLCVEEIADYLMLSSNHVRQVFKNICGKSISEFIVEQRVRIVCELLISTHTAVTAIAEESGFQTKSHFYTAFKKATGMTPNQYRQYIKHDLPKGLEA